MFVYTEGGENTLCLHNQFYSFYTTNFTHDQSSEKVILYAKYKTKIRPHGPKKSDK